MHWEWIALVLTGAILIAMEVYVPGFVVGSIGVVLQAVGVTWCAKLVDANTLFFIIAGTIVLDVLGVVCAIKFFPRTGVGKKMILSHTQDVYKSAVAEPLETLVGREGVAESMLRPTGTAWVDGRRVDVVTEGEYIERGAKVKVVAIKESRLVVKKLTQ